jgi:hypothetical protein
LLFETSFGEIDGIGVWGSYFSPELSKMRGEYRITEFGGLSLLDGKGLAGSMLSADG